MAVPDSTVYEFNAPQFLNFTSSIIDDDGADKFFDTVDVERGSGSSIPTSSDAVTSTTMATLVAQSSNNIKCEPPMIEVSANEGDNVSSPKQKDWDHLSKEIDDKIRQAKTGASARSIKRSFAPAFEPSEDGENPYKVVAVELFHPGIPLQPHKKYTKVQPFSFEERHKRLQKEKEEKIKKVLEEEKKKREFRANPPPRFIDQAVRYSTVLCTEAKEPKLRTEERILERKKIKSENDKPSNHFKARPATVLQKPPFEPKKPTTQLTDVSNIHLNTEERAKKREEFNALIRKKEAQLEILKLQRKREEEKLLAEEIRQMREKAVHKAIPVPEFKPVPPIFSKIPLTEPHSPCFASRNLKKSQYHNHN